jgi:hypothetical protein
MHRFQVDAVLDPQSLLRVANQFAQRSIVPQALRMQLRPAHMHIEVDVAGLEARQAEVIAAKLGEVVAVMRSELESVERAVSVPGRARPALTAVG